METINANDPDALARATAALDAGELVIIPADLDHVVAADALGDDALEKLLLATHRGADRGILVLVGGAEDLHHVAYGGPGVHALAERHWPGPTALALKPRPWLPDAVLGAQPTVRVSVPRDAFARELARRFGPLAVARAPEGFRHAALRVEGGARPGGAVALVAAGQT